MRKSTDGSLTVEVVLWLPLVLMTVALIVDASMMFQGHTAASRILQDANRRVSVGWAGSLVVQQDAALEAARIQTLETNTEAYALSRLTVLSPRATVQTTIVSGVATTVVQMPASDLYIIGLISAFTAASVDVTSQFYLEM